MGKDKLIQLEKIDEAYPLRKIQVIIKIIALTFPEAGRLFFMCKIQNGNNYINRGQYNHEFFVCTHIHFLLIKYTIKMIIINKVLTHFQKINIDWR